MNKQQMADKAAETLRPFETQNLMDTIQTLTIHETFSHPVVLLVIAAVFFFGILKRSTPILLTLFFLLAMIVFMRYLMPVPGDHISLGALVPFIGMGLVLGGVIIYFSMIKS